MAEGTRANAEWKTITEGLARIRVPAGEKISKKLPAFYNPAMEFNRTVSVVVLATMLMKSEKNRLSVLLPLAGTGVRAARIAREIPVLNEKASLNISANDINPTAVNLIKENIEKNIAGSGIKCSVTCEEANRFMMNSGAVDYLDIDPFGSPNPFLDVAVKKVKAGGVLAVTATDTAPLCGTYPKACMRKYWAKPLRGSSMHELGLRILIRKVQLVGAQYEIALTPVLSYSKDHYMRVFFNAKRQKSAVDLILKKHSAARLGSEEAGPLWSGMLQDEGFISEAEKTAVRMMQASEDKQYRNVLEKTAKFLGILGRENSVGGIVGVTDIHMLCKKNKLPVPPFEKVITGLKNRKFKAERSHSNLNALKTDAEEKDVLEVIRSILRNE
ncbi:hypothetical protein D6764_05620 [Candidatus Woesearchaeota archaeon]|nr:MAG: hypothetical protein D6764_05620 [Candidatus Woesearchaeota archaeon]